MKMSAVDEALLVLVRAGLWERDIDGQISLTESQWDEVLDLARKQTVSGLVARGLEHLAEGSTEPSDPAYMRLAVETDKCESRNMKMKHLQEKLFAGFEAQGLHPVQLKGQSVARYYACPELRESGDIDVYFSAEEFEKAVPQDAVIASDGSAEYIRDGVVIELHRQLIDISDPRKQEIIDILIDRYGFEGRTTSPMLTAVLLASHILKHCLGRGVGLRQICDYARAMYVLNLDKKDLSDVFASLGISKWVAVLDSFCRRYLDADFEDKESSLSERLLGIVLAGGNFGQHSGRSDGAWNTFLAFFSNIGFSLRVSPGETFWTVIGLAKGRMDKNA